MNYIIFVRTPIIEILDPPLSPAANNTSRIIADMFTQLDRLKALLKAEERERLAAVRLQAAGRGLLARRRAQSLREEKCLAIISRAIMCPSSEEQAAVRLQAAGRGFLARWMVRKVRMLLSTSLQQIAACAFNHPILPILHAAPAEVEIWVCRLPARQRTAVSFILEPALVLDRSNVRAGWYILHSSSDMKPAVQLFPWDPGGHSCSPNLFYILVPNLFHILVLNNKGKPSCKRLNLRSCHVSLR
jgi:hypothetical protein